MVKKKCSGEIAGKKILNISVQTWTCDSCPTKKHILQIWCQICSSQLYWWCNGAATVKSNSARSFEHFTLTTKEKKISFQWHRSCLKMLCVLINHPIPQKEKNPFLLEFQRVKVNLDNGRMTTGQTPLLNSRRKHCILDEDNANITHWAAVIWSSSLHFELHVWTKCHSVKGELTVRKI